MKNKIKILLASLLVIPCMLMFAGCSGNPAKQTLSLGEYATYAKTALDNHYLEIKSKSFTFETKISMVKTGLDEVEYYANEGDTEFTKGVFESEWTITGSEKVVVEFKGEGDYNIQVTTVNYECDKHVEADTDTGYGYKTENSVISREKVQTLVKTNETIKLYYSLVEYENDVKNNEAFEQKVYTFSADAAEALTQYNTVIDTFFTDINDNVFMKANFFNSLTAVGALGSNFVYDLDLYKDDKDVVADVNFAMLQDLTTDEDPMTMVMNIGATSVLKDGYASSQTEKLNVVSGVEGEANSYNIEMNVSLNVTYSADTITAPDATDWTQNVGYVSLRISEYESVTEMI